MFSLVQKVNKVWVNCRLLVESGLRVDPFAEDCTRVRTWVDPSHSNLVHISITFPTSLCARQGAQVIATFEKSSTGQGLVVDRREELGIALRTLSVSVSGKVWEAVKMTLKEKLDTLRYFV